MSRLAQDPHTGSAPTVAIGETVVGADRPPFLVAEAGVNHNGDPELAHALLEEAARAGAACVKFQLFRAEDVVTAEAPKARYQLQTTSPEESQFAMLKALELPTSAYPALVERSRTLGIEFMCTAYAADEIDFLDDLGVPAFKFASAQIVELPLIRHAARKGKPLVLSTGMATLAEIAEAVEASRGEGAEVVLLQCTTNYPSDPADANLRVIPTLAERFGAPVGYSDHTAGDATAIASVACGASLVEKHFTLDRSLPGPDHSSSLEPAELAALAASLHTAHVALGSSEKAPTARELENAFGMRRSLVAATPIAAGAQITADAVAFKRPASGLPPGALDRVVGLHAKVDIAPDTPLTYDILEAR